MLILAYDVICAIHLEHNLPEQILILLSELPVNNTAKLREVNKTIPGNLIGQVKDFLFKWV